MEYPPPNYNNENPVVDGYPPRDYRNLNDENPVLDGQPTLDYRNLNDSWGHLMTSTHISVFVYWFKSEGSSEDPSELQ